MKIGKATQADLNVFVAEVQLLNRKRALQQFFFLLRLA
jgi:hypothetical protein